jgi:ribosomal protein S18 acetylase RimI-like enzyme
MNTTATIRQAIVDDRTRIKEIIGLSFPRFFRFFATQSISDTHEPTLVSEQEGVVVGFAKLIEFNVGNGKYGCILWIAVHPAYRRRGIALGLTDAGVDYLKQRGAQAVFASTQRRNSAALATLGRAGFERVGFLGLWRFFGWRVLEFYGDVWFAPGELVLMCGS